MVENLIGASRILLFGRAIDDVQLVPSGGSSARKTAKGASPEPLGANHFLADQRAENDSRLARVYAFSYEGGYYELARPTLYLVHGDGSPITNSVDLTGVAASADAFASDIRVWSYDKADLSVRLDVDSGTFEQILIDAEVTGDRLRGKLSGQNARISRQNARISGQNARVSGQNARLRPRGED
jgi:hypothetical protein